MNIRHPLGYCVVLFISVSNLHAAHSELADAVMNRNKDAVRTLIQRKVDVNAPQIDGMTALHWAVRQDDPETVDLLTRAGANVSATNREGVTPMLLATLNGNALIVGMRRWIRLATQRS
jgi:ankyrin repeat protein